MRVRLASSFPSVAGWGCAVRDELVVPEYDETLGALTQRGPCGVFLTADGGACSPPSIMMLGLWPTSCP